MDSVNTLRKNNYQPIIVCLKKIAFKLEGEVWGIATSRNSKGSIKVIPGARDTEQTEKQSKC